MRKRGLSVFVSDFLRCLRMDLQASLNSSETHRDTLNGHSSSKAVLPYVFIALIVIKSAQSILHQKRKGKGNKLNGSEEDYSAFEALPGPISIPIIGLPLNLLWNRDALSLLTQLTQKYGACYKMNIANDTYVVLNSPEFIKALLSSTDHGHSKKSPLFTKTWPEGFDVLLIKTGQEWQNSRRILNHSFTYRSLTAYNDSFNKHSDRLVSELKKLFSEGKVHSKSVEELVTTCIFHLSSETLMGVDISDSEDGPIFVESMERLVTMNTTRFLKPWLLILWVYNLWYGKEQEELIRRLWVITNKIISMHQEKLKANDDGIQSACTDNKETSIDDEDVDVKSRSVIEVMISNGATTKEIMDEVAATLMVAQETTSVTILNTLFLLALHPEHQRKCQAEIDQIFGDTSKSSSGYIEYSALPELKYLERCIMETMRVRPLVATSRKLDSPLKLSEDLIIPAGVSAFPSFPNLNPEYFPDPMKFDPDRFSPDEVRKRHPYAFTPFSMGPRGCIGRKLAMVELKMVISKILRNFNVSTPDRWKDVKIVNRGSFKPAKPINFKFELRV